MVATGPDNFSRSTPLPGAVALALVLLLPAVAHAGKLYRWVDQDGNVHYTDRMPAGATDEAHAVIDEQGTVVDRKDTTAAEREKQRQREATRAEERRKAEARRREIEERKRRDRIILQTFSTERDIELTRKSRVEAVQVQINIADHGINRLEEERKTLRQQLENLPDDSPVAERNRERLTQVEARLQQRRRNKQNLEVKREEIEQRFDGYIERFRELRDTSG